MHVFRGKKCKSSCKRKEWGLMEGFIIGKGGELKQWKQQSQRVELTNESLYDRDLFFRVSLEDSRTSGAK